jgi:glycosyltransferase involved in cell wall biosynthesis
MPTTHADDRDAIDFTLVLPGYNERLSLPNAVERSKAALGDLRLSYEIIIVNDCSTDDTGQIADQLAAADPNIRVIHNPINLNVGASILIGYKSARGRLMAYNGVDLPFDPRDLGAIVPMFDDPEIAAVAVVRTDRSAHSAWRKVTSFVHHWMVRILFWTDVPDMNFVQIWRRSMVQDLGVRARSPAFVTPEMIIRTKNAGMKIVQASAVFHTRKAGEAKFGKPRDILWTLSDMISFWLEGSGRSAANRSKRASVNS